MPPSQKINLKDKIDDGEIDLSMCDLQDVPVKDIAHTKNIFSLDLSNNHLVTLPKTFSTLNFLTKLDLSKNSLKELPDNFGDLIKLKHLDLYKNQLQHLPLSFSKLKALKWLDLKDNPLVPVIREAAGPCLDTKQCLTCAKNIVQFYNDFQHKLQLEREAREKQRLKDMQDQALQKQKQLEKKNRKKEKKQKLIETVIKETLIDEPIVEKKTMYTTTSEVAYKKKSIPGAISYFLKMCLVHLFFIALFAFLITSLKLESTQQFETNVVKQWKQVVERLPPPSQSYLNDFNHYFNLFHVRTGNGIYIVIYYITNIVNKINMDNIKYVYERAINLYYDLFKVK